MASLKARDILVLGEQHAIQGDSSWKVHQGRQVELLKALTSNAPPRSLQLHVGMEFLEYPDQGAVDEYLNGRMSDADFIKAVKWGGNPFEPYKQQILEPTKSGGRTWALNAPREITRQVSKGGLGSLTSDQGQYLPPNLTRGNGLYFERFENAMAGHATPQQIDNYFWSQSIWDETMAWKALQTFPPAPGTPDRLLVVIVGQFHVEYGGGLPDRLNARAQALKAQGQEPVTVKTLIQRPLLQVDNSTVSEAVAASPRYGELADYIWIYEDPNASP